MANNFLPGDQTDNALRMIEFLAITRQLVASALERRTKVFCKQYVDVPVEIRRYSRRYLSSNAGSPEVCEFLESSFCLVRRVNPRVEVSYVLPSGWRDLG